ncbi:MAG: hypothetical protein M3020_08240 [Myxococcota bacterium]|nr:hypothetical protein [Myxococcota bacterium]
MTETLGEAKAEAYTVEGIADLAERGLAEIRDFPAASGRKLAEVRDWLAELSNECAKMSCVAEVDGTDIQFRTVPRRATESGTGEGFNKQYIPFVRFMALDSKRRIQVLRGMGDSVLSDETLRLEQVTRARVRELALGFLASMVERKYGLDRK